MGNSLAVVRQNLSGAVGDLIMGQANSGTSTTLVDTMLRKPDDYYNEHHYRLYIYGGTNQGEEREISDWTLTSPANTLTLAPAFTAAIGSGSYYELHYIFTEDEYRKAINMAIQTLADGHKYVLDKIDISSITLAADVYEYALPSGMDFIHRITTEDTADSGEFEHDDEIDPRDWELISPRRLKLHESRYSITAGLDLRVEGQGAQATVDDDADDIELPLDWLVQKAITSLPKGKIQSSKLDTTYNQALALAAKEPRRWPNPHSRRVVE
uniref:Uncharacterized protein n=1 Tax=viral metagenome TaxID=1070528 RepID=A0A6M3KVG3_9ZZZZ